ncbi:hypothetical protein KR074_011759, partial [Drosophila pseudoananassae]
DSPPNQSIMGKVKKRVSSILPSSLSGWFSPSSKSSADPVFLTNQQPNGCIAQKRKRGRCRIELAADGGAEDSPAGFDVGDAKGLNYEEVALADNIAEHDLAAEDEQTRRSEYSESVFQLRKRLDTRGPYENVDGSEEDVDDEDVEEEEEGDEDDDEDEHDPNSAMHAHKRRRMEMLETTVTLPNMRRLPLGSSTPAAPVPANAATESQLLKSRNSSQQRQQGAHRRTRLNQFGNQRQREPAYNFLTATEEVPHSIRRSLNIPSSTSSVSGSQNNSLSSSLFTKIKGRLALNHQERNYEEALLGIGAGEEDQLLRISKSNNNNTNNINNNVIKSNRRVGAIGDSHSESELNEYEENCDNDGLRSSNSNLEFYGNLQSSKSIFNRLNTTAGSQQPARHNSSWSLVSLNRRRRFNASIYGSTSALSDSRLLSRSASAAAASPTASSSSSPFYQGRTTFGGNAANNRVFSQTNLSSSAASSTLAINSGRSSPAQVLLGGISYGLKPVDMKPSNTDSSQSESVTGTAPPTNATTQSKNSNLSNTTQRILNLLDSYSTPLIDAKRMGSTLREHQSRQRRTPYSMTEPSHESPAPKTPAAELEELRSNQLLVPTMQQLLERRRLHRVTQTSRDLVRAEGNTLISGESKAPQPAAGEQAHSHHTNKMRSKLSHQTRKQPTEDSAEAPRPLDLPQISFPAMASTPKFDLQFKVSAAPAPTPSSQDPSRSSNLMSRDYLVQAKPAPSSNVTQNGNASSKAAPTLARQFSFPTPTSLEEDQNSSGRRRNNVIKVNPNFQFPAPAGLSEAEKEESSSSGSSSDEEDEVDQTAPAKTQSAPAINGFGEQFKKSASEWECDLCMVRNKSEASKCVACESPKPGAKPAAATLVAMPYPPIVPITSGFGDRFKKSSSAWECDACMLSNKQEATKCVACETPRKTAQPPPPNPLAPLSGSGFGDAFKPKANTWECQTCMVTNQSSAAECVACQVPNRNVSNSPQGNSSEGAASNSNSNSSSSSSSVSSSTPSVISISSGSSNGGPALKFGAPQPPKADSGFQQLVAKQKAQNWDCDTCMAQNDISRAKCICCEQARPGTAASATAGSSAPTAASAVPKFSFGFGAVKEVTTSKPAVLLAPATPADAAPAPAPFAFGFGQSSAAKTDVADGQKPLEPAKPTFSFGLGKVETPKTVTFKEDKKEAPAPAPVAVESNKVSVPAPEAAAEPSPVSQFVFRAPTTSNVTSTATSSAVTATPALFSFGAPAASSSVVSSSTGTTTAPPAKPSFSFGTAATSSAASSTTSSSQPALSFGGFTSAATSAATSTTTTFSANPAPAATSVPNPAPTFNFGSGALGKPAAAPGTFFFGQSPAAPAAPTAPAASVPTTVSTGTSMGQVFGISVSTSTSSISSSIVSTSSSVATTTPMVFNFGAEKKTEALAGATSKPFVFGSGTASTTVAPTFGNWPSNGAITSANSMVPLSSASTSAAFGSSMFGVPAISSSPFGSTTTTAAATPAPSFSLGGNGPMHPVFGNVGNSMVNPGATATPAVAAPASANIFGSASATPIAAAAAAPIFGSGVTSSGFGAAASATTGTSAPSGAKLAFNFGGAPAASGAPFNFGVSSNAPPKPTFNFTGSVTASTPQAGAFNFSAGSAAPSMGGGD